MQTRDVFGVRIDCTTYHSAVRRIIAWADQRECRYVCACNVHMIMEAHDDRGFLQTVNEADLVTADGMPIVWTLRRMGVPEATRVYGPTLMLRVCEAASHAGIPVGLYGSTAEVLSRLEKRLTEFFPSLVIDYRHSPPFGQADDTHDLQAIRESGVQILFVGLGCPRQERWMAENRASLKVVMLGVGAAFDFLSGTKRQAPSVLQNAGLEWVFRFLSEPRRLWRRYARHNPRFAAMFVKEAFRGWKGR